MATYVKDECPVCASGAYNIISTVNEAAPPVQIPENSVIAECKGCRLIYVNPMPFWNADDYSRLYDETYFAHFETDAKKNWLDVRKNIIPKKRFGRILPRLATGKKKMLEIGAGQYAFMSRFLLAQGWDVTAQEPSELFCEKLRAVENLKIENREVKDLTGVGDYSLIFADSVLEHVPDPINYYRKFADLLTDGGVLYTVSPNEISTYNFIFKQYIAPYRQPYHLTGFSKKSLQILAKKSGLELVSYKKIDDYMAFHALNSNRSAAVRYPMALLYAASQAVGLGTNGEALFLK